MLAFVSAAAAAQDLPHHELRVTLDPQSHWLRAHDHVTLPAGGPRTREFRLHRGLHPVSADAQLANVPDAGDGLMETYRVTLAPSRDSFTLDYGGEIFHPPQQDAREARTFESSAGIIDPEGTVLTGDSGWYPVDDDRLAFTLDVSMPQGWRAVSQGSRLADQDGHSAWQEESPQQEIYLVAAPFHEYAGKDGGIEDLVYLRQDDAALAGRYLDATARDIAMYQRLIGRYPYAKFALVENFWETGYGMPSFTLLGSQVIRLPFIIDTSYPHEILHNWWGNGVYVDYATGNWSEGLTAYLADHLMQEQKGNGAEYRRSTLQKYADFVSAGRDFPLTEFRSRHSEQSEAVGYGKGLMLFHMLRRTVGDEAFVRALRAFYGKYLFRQAGFTDLARAFSQATGQDLSPMFVQWVQRAGAPQLALVSARARRLGAGYDLTVVVEQTQPGPAYALDVPVAVTLSGRDAAYSTALKMNDRRVEWHVVLDAQPLRLDIDPEFDVFRRLDPAEIPPAFSQVSGAEKLLIVLPRAAPQALRAGYREIAEAWKGQAGRDIEIGWDDEVARLPEDRAVWLFGWENRFAAGFSAALGGNARLSGTTAAFGGGQFTRGENALALAARIGQTPAAWLGAPDARMLPALARKLPHYAKYSYAAFTGPEVTNLARGMWPVTGSPLGRGVVQEDGTIPDVPRGTLPPRQSLSAEPAP